MKTTPGINEALQRYQAYLSPADYARLLAASRQAAPGALRVNRLKVPNPTAFTSDLAARYGWKLQALPFSADSWQVLESQTPPSQTPEHQLGCYYLQDAASILPAAMFNNVSGPIVTLDMAASPGGKTTQLVDLVQDASLVIANDSSAGRLPALRTVLQLWGSASTAVTNFAGERWGDWYPESFDRVLLDAPCSMESLRETKGQAFRPTSQAERSRLAIRQEALLDSGLRALITGGELVYSTCSLAPEEDEAVVSALLERYPGVIEVAERTVLQKAPPALTRFEGQNFLPDLQKGLRLWPFTLDTNGFFAIKLRKTGALPTQEATLAPQRPFRATGLRKPAAETAASVLKQIEDDYGFILVSQMAQQNLEMYIRDGKFWLLPADWLARFASLPYHALGMELGSMLKGIFEASADFILRYGHLFSRGKAILPDEALQQWLNGHDLRDQKLGHEGPAKLTAVFSQSGLNLGPGKILPGRVRNMLPRRNLRLN